MAILRREYAKPEEFRVYGTISIKPSFISTGLDWTSNLAGSRPSLEAVSVMMPAEVKTCCWI